MCLYILVLYCTYCSLHSAGSNSAGSIDRSRPPNKYRSTAYHRHRPRPYRPCCCLGVYFHSTLPVRTNICNSVCMHVCMYICVSVNVTVFESSQQSSGLYYVDRSGANGFQDLLRYCIALRLDQHVRVAALAQA